MLAAGRKVSMKGCERRGIQDEVERGSETYLDPFNDIDPTE